MDRDTSLLHSPAHLVARLANQHVLVVGDVTLDEYLYGRATRLSREAPVPVLEMTQREIVLGGAANPARNIVALASTATLVGVVGDDVHGQQFRLALQHGGIGAEGLIPIADRATTTKTRIMAHESPRLPQQVARLDVIDRTPLNSSNEQHIVDVLAERIPSVDAVLCSDYQLGLLTPRVVDTIRTLCNAHRVLLTVDAQGNSHYYREVDLFRCNNVEASRVLGRPLETEEDFCAGLHELQERLRSKLVIVTRGPAGLSLVGDTVDYTHLEAMHVSEVYDTTGAGDTFIAIVTLALVAGIAPCIAAQLANGAAALVVRKFGNAVVSPAELTQFLHQSAPHV